MSDTRKPNDRSDDALRERLVIAEKATQGPWKSDEVVTRKKDFEPSYVVKDKDGFTIVDVLPVPAYQANAAHIAASSPDVVREDIEEILQLRKEVARLNKEADWLGLRLWGTGGVPPVEDFDVRADRIKMWRKAVEEKERYG